LGDSASALLAGLEAVTAIQVDLVKLSVYASSRSDEDTRLARPRELKQGAQKLSVDLASATAWIRPEILSLDPAKVRGFLAQEPKLAPYRVFLDDVLRWKPHTLSASEEQVAALASDLTDTGQTSYGTLKDADLPYPTVKFSTGEVRLDTAAFTLYRASKVKADRDLAFQSFFVTLKGFERTFGTTLDAQVKGCSRMTSPPPSTRSWWPTFGAAYPACTASSDCGSACWASRSSATRISTCPWSGGWICASNRTRPAPSPWRR
jgi:oligoendopeptidase F